MDVAITHLKKRTYGCAVRVCVCACVRVCVRACMCVCNTVYNYLDEESYIRFLLNINEAQGFRNQSDCSIKLVGVCKMHECMPVTLGSTWGLRWVIEIMNSNSLYQPLKKRRCNKFVTAIECSSTSNFQGTTS